MPDRQLIGPVPGTTPESLKGSGRRHPPLPADLQREASRRLGIMGLIGASLWAAGAALAHTTSWMMGEASGLQPTSIGIDIICAASFTLSLGLFFYARRPGRDPIRILDLGLVYMVLTSLALGLMIHWDPKPDRFSIFPMVSLTGAVVLMFAAIVPSTPIKTLIAGLIAVSMNPVSMLIARARGTWPFGQAGDALIMHYPDYLLVGVAVVISYVVTRLGQQVARAREMGSYQLGELIGRGGMGEVYRARHRMLARSAAIKLIRPETIGAENGEPADLVTRRFRREAEVAATLRSPHTVALYDFGVTEDETLYFVMELLDGMDLETLVRKHGPLPAGRVIFILRQICESLAEAHARGLVHRDIKPANIHIGRLGLKHDFVKVLDFGLVKSMANAKDGDSIPSVIGHVPGTPAYMAPELAFGQPLDGRADLYSLGCVAWFLLTGRLVFEAATSLQMIAKHTQEIPAPPSRVSELPVPEAMDRLVLACLAKKPEDRPASAEALDRMLGEIETAAWDEPQAARWWQTHRRE